MSTDFRFIGISPSVDLTERRSAMLNEQTEPFTLDDMRGYKAFTALLTQSGGSVTYSLQAAPIVVGVTYMIFDSIAGDDFRNVGGPLIVNNNDFNNTYFIATGTTPTNWSGETGLEYNTGAPVATVLENNIDSNVYFTYYGDGTYILHSDGAFFSGNVGILFGQTNTDVSTTKIYAASNQEVWIEIFSDKNVYSNNLLNNTLIEIRIYN